MTTHLMTDRKMVRQGDVLIMPVDTVPDTALGDVVTEGEGKRIVLAHGEATGHAHAIYPSMDASDGVSEAKCGPPKLFELSAPEKYSSLPCRLLRLETRGLVRHEEHDPISLPAGDWLVIIQHEGDELEGLRRVF
jgi:hypothetical protein